MTFLAKVQKICIVLLNCAFKMGRLLLLSGDSDEPESRSPCPFLSLYNTQASTTYKLCCPEISQQNAETGGHVRRCCRHNLRLRLAGRITGHSVCFRNLFRRFGIWRGRGLRYVDFVNAESKAETDRKMVKTVGLFGIIRTFRVG